MNGPCSMSCPRLSLRVSEANDANKYLTVAEAEDGGPCARAAPRHL